MVPPVELPGLQGVSLLAEISTVAKMLDLQTKCYRLARN